MFRARPLGWEVFAQVTARSEACGAGQVEPGIER